tara:strand:+ start:8617 stop:9198 length:582 start_codon:yes stop_codon:yes gene_type:complete
VNKNINSKLQLASSSPRRKKILSSLGIDFDVFEIKIDESQLIGECPSDMVLRLAATKAEAHKYGDFVLGADTIVVHESQIFGKPNNAKDAIDMLLSLSGKEHIVMTGVALKAPDGTKSLLSTTKVRFRKINKKDALNYWKSGEPVDKAGSYGIQGIGGMFVKSISGSYSGVVGLPVFETVSLLTSSGFNVLNQ